MRIIKKLLTIMLLFALIISSIVSINPIVVKAETQPLPTKWDNTDLAVNGKYFPPIGNQGGLGSCAYFSEIYYMMTYYVAKDRNWTVRSSEIEYDNYKICNPAWVWNQNSFIKQFFNSIECESILSKNGCGTYAYLNYSSDDTLSWCTNPEGWKQAMNYRLDSFTEILFTYTELDKVKRALSEGKILSCYTSGIFSWEIKSVHNAMDQKIAIAQNGKNGSHAMTIVGYDDNIEADINGDGTIHPTERGAFKIANSWGSSWNNKGFIWLAYDALNAYTKVPDAVNKPGRLPALGNEPTDLTINLYYMNIKSQYSPKLYAEFTISHSKRDDLGLSLGVSNLNESMATSKWNSAVINYCGGPFNLKGDGTINNYETTYYLDYTDLMNQLQITDINSKKWYLIINDLPGNTNYAKLKSFKLVDNVGNRSIGGNDLNVVIDSEEKEFSLSFGCTNHNIAKSASCTENSSPCTVCGYTASAHSHNYVNSNCVYCGEKLENCIDKSFSSESNYTAFGADTGAVKVWQTFKSTDNCKILSSIDLKLKRINSHYGSDVTVELQGVNSLGIPNGVTYSSSIIPAEKITSEYSIINVPLRYDQVMPSSYAIVLSQRNLSENPCYLWPRYQSDTSLKTGSYNGFQYVEDSSNGDFWFKCYGGPEGSVNLVSGSSGSGYGFGSSSDEVKRWQTFTANSGPNLSHVSVSVKKGIGTAHSDMTVELYNTKNNKPIGNALVKTVVKSEKIGSTFKAFDVPLKYNGLVTGGKYAVVLGQVTPSSSIYCWSVNEVSSTSYFGKYNGLSTYTDESNLGDGYLSVYTTNDTSINTTYGSNLGGAGCIFGAASDNVKRWQTFYSNSNQYLTGVNLLVQKNQIINYSDLVVELYDTTGGKPTGQALTQYAYPSKLIPNYYSSIYVPVKYMNLEKGREYAIVLGQKVPGSSSYSINNNGFKVFPNTHSGKINETGTVIDESSAGDSWIRVFTVESEVPTAEDNSFINGAHIIDKQFADSQENEKRWQNFTAKTPNLSGINLMLSKDKDEDPGDVKIELYGTTNGIPTGQPLSSAIIPSYKINEEAIGICSAPLKYNGLIVGKEYSIVLSKVVPATGNNVNIRMVGSYRGLPYGNYNSSSGQYTAITGSDLTTWMRLYFKDPITKNRIIDVTSSAKVVQSARFGSLTGTSKRYQTFITDKKAHLNKIQFRIKTPYSDSSCGVAVDIYAATNDTPTGSPLATSIIPSTAIGNTFSNISAYFDYELNANTEYAIVLRCLENSDDSFIWQIDNKVNTDFNSGSIDDNNNIIDESDVGDTWMKVFLSVGKDKIDMSNMAQMGYNFGDSASAVKRWQTFTANSKMKLSGVDIKINKLSGSTHTDVVVQLYNTLNNKPTGSPIASFVLNESVVPFNNPEIINVPIKYSNLIFGNKYAVVLSQQTPSTSKYQWIFSEIDRNCTSGIYDTSNNWIDQSNLGDGWMRVYLDD